MKAVLIEAHGGPEVLTLIDRPDPAPGPGQAVVRHEAIGLNFIDIYHRTGLYPVKLPAVIGGEAAGVVKAVGEGVTDFRPGDRVAYALSAGAYAEMNLVPGNRLVHVPEGVDSRTAAAVLLKGMTAEFLAERIWPLQPGDAVLVHAAAGGVGGLLVQWLAEKGQTVIATAGGPDKVKIAEGHGAHHVIDYDRDDVAARVRELTDGRGVRVAFDSVGKATLEASLASIGRRGLLVSYGNASGAPPAIEPGRLARQGSLYLTRPTLGDFVASPEELTASAKAVFDRVADGRLKVEIGQTWPLAEVRAAHEALEERRTVGASVLVP